MKIFVLYCLALLVTVLALSDANYVNNYDESALMDCPHNQYMYRITSVHSNHHEDRRWEFNCRGGVAIHSCAWSGFVNDFDQPLSYTCPGNKVITGIHSYHDNRREDRRFKFRCCGIVGKTANNCAFTNYVNNWDGQLTVSAGPGYAIKGAISHHSNHREDRRWKFLLCSLN